MRVSRAVSRPVSALRAGRVFLVAACVRAPKRALLGFLARLSRFSLGARDVEKVAGGVLPRRSRVFRGWGGGFV